MANLLAAREARPTAKIKVHVRVRKDTGKTYHSADEVSPVTSFTVRCGHKSTFRWLAQVATQRYCQVQTDRQAGGLRQRDNKAIAKSLLGGAMQPLAVSTSEAIPQFRHPNQLLFEGPDAIPFTNPEVWVTLTGQLAMHAVPEDEPERPTTAGSQVGAPITSRWRTMAYRNSRPSRQREAEAAEALIRENQSGLVAKQKEDDKLAERMRKVNHVREVLKEQISFEAETAEKETRDIRCAALAATQEEQEQSMLIKLLGNHMSSIKDIFKVFSSGSAGEKGDIDLKEWLNLAKVARFFQRDRTEPWQSKSTAAFQDSNYVNPDVKLTQVGVGAACRLLTPSTKQLTS